MSTTDEKEPLRSLGRKYLSLQGQSDLEAHLQDGQIELAKLFLLGAIDHGWRDKEINDETAREAYKLIGISPEKAAETRQRSKYWK